MLRPLIVLPTYNEADNIAEVLRRARAAAPDAGILVVDLSRHLPGPLAAHLLAGLGARVIKVEEPLHGDPVREAPPHREGQGALATLLGLHSGRASLRA